MDISTDLGLKPCNSFLFDRQFIWAWMAGVGVAVCMYSLFPEWRLSQASQIDILLLLSLLLLQPVVEELLFRGVFQGRFLEYCWGRKLYLGASAANVMTSLLFVAAHLINHSFLWAVSVFIPSLLFGYFRERYGSVYPSIFLHMSYNTFYFLPVVVWNGSFPPLMM